MSSFAFLTAEFPTVHDAAVAAERQAAGDPTAVAFLAGKTVEIAAIATSASAVAVSPVAPRETMGYRSPS